MVLSRKPWVLAWLHIFTLVPMVGSADSPSAAFASCLRTPGPDRHSAASAGCDPLHSSCLSCLFNLCSPFSMFFFTVAIKELSTVTSSIVTDYSETRTDSASHSIIHALSSTRKTFTWSRLSTFEKSQVFCAVPLAANKTVSMEEQISRPAAS